MPITALPTPPNTGDPANFAPQASALLGALPTFVSEANAMAAAFGPGAPVCTVGGTANAVTLTSGMNISALVAGQRVLFRPAAANTGGATLNLDGRGARTARTITGAALPAGYLRSGVFTEAIYDGTDWIVNRLPERGSNANGDFVRHADGILRCRFNMNTSDTGEVTWSFPALFSTTAGLIIQGTIITALGPATVVLANLTTSGVGVNGYDVGGTRRTRGVNLAAEGPWY
ncbi:hypothetical protein [Rubellimicrobium arenae]|uniref:hypothetical protein n=1 Tax=Rubellimicrobium arenae TaxID=2817372 RepID=UPI001B3026D9|nr:hypothetical protein [Rubellimicrobium arenae]